MSCFITHYASPLGRLLLAADEEGLTGLWLEGQKYFAAGLPQQREEQRTPALEEACRWLDTYFTGREPDFTPPLHPVGWRVPILAVCTGQPKERRCKACSPA